MADPRYAGYLSGWPRHGDVGLVAEQDGPVGAAWYRTYTEADHGYGFVAEDVPELAIAVVASRRARASDDSSCSASSTPASLRGTRP